MARAKKIKAKTELDPIHKTPKRFYDVDETVTGRTPRAVAEAFLRKAAPSMGINPDLSQLRFDQVKDSILGKHVLFQQYHDNKPITGAWVRIDVGQGNDVYNVESSLIPDKALAKTSKAPAVAARAAAGAVTQAQAIKIATEAVSAPQQPAAALSTEDVMFPVDGVPRPAWKVVVVREQPRGEWKVYVDRATSTVLDTVPILKAAKKPGPAKARVFDPNPVVTLNDTTLEDTSTVPDAAYFEVTLSGLNSSGQLDGEFVNTKTTTSRIKRTDLDFRFRRADRAFKEVMVYFHIDHVQRYIQQLGFSNVLNRSISANVDGIRDDNSFYSPTTKSLTFGTGGVDDAEDAEIILHEYGHAIQDNQVNGFGSKPEGRAMGEGFGDYLAASFFFDRKPALLRPTVGNWDAVAYSGANPPFLRRLDSNKLYPRDMVGEEHADGEIWSACLWQLRAALGGRTADTLVLAHHSLLTPQSGFEDAAKALITADGRLNDGRNEAAIRSVFVARGILPNAKRRNRRAGITFDAIHERRDGRGAARKPARTRRKRNARRPV